MTDQVSRISRLKLWVRRNKVDISLLFVLLVISGLVHGYNIFHYPYYENDEATYISQAWSFLTQGNLAPYTYWYDHAPAGWIFLSFWQAVTGGAKLFGGLYQDGRAFMLVLHLASVAMIYFITLKISKSRIAAVIAVLFFSLSPLGIFFQRRVLLDNIIVFWVFASVSLLLLRYRIRWVVLSGICLGIAVLSKETAIVVLPAVLYLLYLRSEGHRKWAFSQWFGVFISIIAIYLLYALLRNELFPTGSWLGGSTPHVSLIGSIEAQGSRGQFYFPWQTQSAFFMNAAEWIGRDPLLMIFGTASLITCAFLGIKRRIYLVIVASSIAYILFFARGKLLIDFYVVPLLPWLAIAAGVSVATVIHWMKFRPLKHMVEILICAALVIFYFPRLHDAFTRDDTANQFAAISWVEHNISPSASIAIDDYAYPSLQEQNNFKNADWFYKIEDDPAIQAKYHKDWRNLDYIMLSHDMLQGIRNYVAPYMKQALDHAIRVATFTDNSISYIQLSKYISTYGDWAMVFKVKNREQIATQDNWGTIQSNYFKEYGRIISPTAPTTATLQLETDFMDRALRENDPGAFNGIANWSADHLEHRSSDKLLSSSYSTAGAQPTVVSDADIAANLKYAQLLITASKQFKNPVYANRATAILNDLWSLNVKTIDGTPYLTNQAGEVPVDQLLDPTAVKTFAAFDSAHNWTAIVNADYSLFANVASQSASGAPTAGAVLHLNGQITLDAADPAMNYEMVHALVQDAITTHDPRAIAILQTLKTSLGVIAPFDNPYSAATALDVYIGLSSPAAQQVYLHQPMIIYNSNSHLFGSTDDAATQAAIGTVFADASDAGVALMPKDK